MLVVIQEFVLASYFVGILLIFLRNVDFYVLQLQEVAVYQCNPHWMQGAPKLAV
jgi:hypothetical protein